MKRAVAAGALGAAGFAVYCGQWPTSQVYGATICRGRPGDRRIALTYDDGPNPEQTPRLMEILASYDAHATFFLIGKWAEQGVDLRSATGSGRNPGEVRNGKEVARLEGQHLPPRRFRLGNAPALQRALVELDLAELLPAFDIIRVPRHDRAVCPFGFCRVTGPPRAVCLQKRAFARRKPGVVPGRGACRFFVARQWCPLTRESKAIVGHAKGRVVRKRLDVRIRRTLELTCAHQTFAQQVRLECWQ